jgi:hypothetical protein
MCAGENFVERSVKGFAECWLAGRIREESVTVWRFVPLSAFEVLVDFGALLLNRAGKKLFWFRSCGIRTLHELALKHKWPVHFLVAGVAELSLKVCVTPPVAAPAPSFNAKAQPRFHDGLNQVFKVGETQVVQFVINHGLFDCVRQN